MHISDLVGQYNKAGSQAEPITRMKGVERLVSSMSELSKGNVFEGTVNSVKGDKVYLGLSNGTQIAARMSGKVSIQTGQSMFFQVKSNNGATIEIRPFTVDGNGANYTLLEALKAAGLPSDSQNIEMVNHMMQEQMSIDKNSLAEMARLLQSNPDVKASTIVDLVKLGIPVDAEMASQYENYMMDKQAITSSMDEFMDAVSNALADENMSASNLSDMGSDILSIITENLPDTMEAVDVPQYAAEINFVVDDVAQNQGRQDMQGTDNLQNAQASENLQDVQAAQSSENVQNTQNVQNEDSTQNVQTGEKAQDIQNTANQDNTKADSVVYKNSLATLMDENGLNSLNDMVKNLLPENRQDGFKPFTMNSLSSEVLNEIGKLLAQNPDGNKDNLIKLFSSREFTNLMKNAMEQQWSVSPKEIAKDYNKIDKIYEKISNQLDRLEEAVKQAGGRSEQVSSLAAEIKGNVNFMNQVNNLYTYVQIPLKMSGQNASGQLYVYTNKKNMKDPDKELSAFLHLDMDHMGSTDISIKMLHKNVDTKFYFDNDAAFELVKQFLPQLDARLREKGYNCKLEAVNEKQAVNFVNDFLKKDMPTAGQLHRYSFDMRA